jgi:hypothetical protein
VGGFIPYTASSPLSQMRSLGSLSVKILFKPLRLEKRVALTVCERAGHKLGTVMAGAIYMSMTYTTMRYTSVAGVHLIGVYLSFSIWVLRPHSPVAGIPCRICLPRVSEKQDLRKSMLRKESKWDGLVVSNWSGDDELITSAMNSSLRFSTQMPTQLWSFRAVPL